DTYKLIQRFFYCEQRGTHLLKGISNPMTIYQPLDSALSASGNMVMERSTATPLIGRDEVMKQLNVFWEHAQKNSEEVALIIGEAGMGKTHLLRKFISQKVGEKIIVITGKCAALFQNNSFHPVTEILFQISGIDSTANDETKLSALDDF